MAVRRSTFERMSSRRRGKKTKPTTLTAPRTMAKPKTGTSGKGSTTSTKLSGVQKRRPKRPVDRQKMRPWLEDKLRNGESKEHLWWVKEGESFAVKWLHAARHGYNASDHATVFKAWALHTEAFKEGDPADPNKWKANFRCALRSLPDVEEITEHGQRKGQNAVRVYRLLEEPIATPGRKNKKPKKQPKGYDEVPREAATPAPVNVQVASSVCSTAISTYAGPSVTSTVSASLPNFSQLGMSKNVITSCSLSSGGCVIVKEDKAEVKPLAHVPPCDIWSGFLTSSGAGGNHRVRSPSVDSGNLSSPRSLKGEAEDAYESPLTSSSDCDAEDMDQDEGLGLTDDDFCLDDFQPVGMHIQPSAVQTQANWSTNLLLESAPSANVITEKMESSVVDEAQMLTALQNVDLTSNMDFEKPDMICFESEDIENIVLMVERATRG